MTRLAHMREIGSHRVAESGKRDGKSVGKYLLTILHSSDGKSPLTTLIGNVDNVGNVGNASDGELKR